MTVVLTIEFNHGGCGSDSARAYELRTAEWLQRLIASNCAFKQPDIHIDLVDPPCASHPSESKSFTGSPSS